MEVLRFHFVSGCDVGTLLGFGKTQGYVAARGSLRASCRGGSPKRNSIGIHRIAGQEDVGRDEPCLAHSCHLAHRDRWLRSRGYVLHGRIDHMVP